MKGLSEEEYSKLLKYTRYHLRQIKDVDAEDVLHEVAFKVFSRMDFEGVIENVVGYFYRAVKNKITELMRKPKKLIPVDLQKDEPFYSDALRSGNTYEDQIHLKSEEAFYQLLHRAIGELPEMYRLVIVATTFEGKTIRELSDEVKVPVGTLLSRRHRALSKLHEMLEKEYNNL